MTRSSPPDTPGPARTGPWTLHCCVTAACTRCGAVPLDEDTGLTPHFDSVRQACEELPRDWDWHLTTRTSINDDELLCPPCAAGDITRQPDAAQPRQEAGQAPELPANTRILPAAHSRQREGG
jgi:hypothetical protein